MPPHLHYVEPYFGGGSVLLTKDFEGISEVANDIDGELTNFWSVLRDEGCFQRLIRLVQATPFAESVYEACTRNIPVDEVEQAYNFFVRARQSRQGLMKDFATITRNRTRRNMNEQVSSWLTAIEGLPEVHARLKRVLILNRNAINVIRQQDGNNTLFYCDPPYLHETRTVTDAYDFEMTAKQHEELLETLCQIQGRFLLSGYMSELYSRYAQDHHWRRVDFDLPNNAASGDSKRRMVEAIWMNF